MSKFTICLWFEHDTEEDASYYSRPFPQIRLDAVHRAPSEEPEGEALTVESVVAGIPRVDLNGGPRFKPCEAFSFQTSSQDRAEMGRYRVAIF